MQNLFEHMGHVGVACYWILVEMCAEKLVKTSEEEFGESHCIFGFHEKILRQNLRISRKNLELFLGYCQGFSLLSFKKSESFIEIAMPKLMESLDRDTKRARTVRAESAPKKKIKNKEEEKEEDKEYMASNDFSESSLPEIHPDLNSISEIIIERKISFKSQQAILQAFPEPQFVISEIKKMLAWEAANPSNKKKNFSRFATNWLTRSWDSRRAIPQSKSEQRQRSNQDALNEVLERIGAKTV